MGASEEHRDASAGRWKAVALPSSAVLCCLMAGCGRTGAVGVDTPCRTHARQGNVMPLSLVSTKALGEVHSRMTTRIGAPQVGQRATRGGGGRALWRLAIAGVCLHDHAGGWSRAGWHSWHGESRSGGLS